MNTAQDTLPRAYTFSDLENKVFKTLAFQGEWLEHLGEVERSGSILIWGDSGHGKTAYALRLGRYLMNFDRVFYNPLEEKARKSFRDAGRRANLTRAGSKFTFRPLEYDALWKHLDRKRMPRIVFIDSVQYFFRNHKLQAYFDLLEYFNETLFIFLSHSSGNLPKGELADAIRYHSDAKIFVKDFMADVKATRYGGGKSMIIWQQGYDERNIKLIS